MLVAAEAVVEEEVSEREYGFHSPVFSKCALRVSTLVMYDSTFRFISSLDLSFRSSVFRVSCILYANDWDVRVDMDGSGEEGAYI